MDHVDSNLRTILHEVNTLEEFETEKAIFQVRRVTAVQTSPRRRLLP